MAKLFAVIKPNAAIRDDAEKAEHFAEDFSDQTKELVVVESHVPVNPAEFKLVFSGEPPSASEIQALQQRAGVKMLVWGMELVAWGEI